MRGIAWNHLKLPKIASKRPQLITQEGWVFAHLSILRKYKTTLKAI